MRVLFSGGGTGGHIYPSLAIMREFERQSRPIEALYIGSDKGLEATIVPKAGVPFETIDIQGFRRKITWDNIVTVQKFIRAVKRSKQLISEFQPDVVVGTGGYVCGPVVYAASRLGIPTLIHEQNVVPGLTNKFLAQFCDIVAVSFEGSEHYFSKAKHLVVSGNPRASEVVAANGDNGRKSLGLSSDQRPIVLISGGSRGARPINDAVLRMISHITAQTDFYVVYITGNIHYEAIMEKIGNVAERSRSLIVLPYVYNMPEVLAASSLVVGRAGASTIAEITALGIPSILIPSPYVTNNHQVKNAQWLEKQGAARVMMEHELSGQALWQSITTIMNDHVMRTKMGQAAERIGQPEAAMSIIKELEKLINNN